jgi:hypothetical protein
MFYSPPTMAWMVGTMLMVTARMMRWSSPIFWKMRKRRKARRMRICLIQAAPPEVRHRRATEESTTPESKSDQGSAHSRVSACPHRSVIPTMWPRHGTTDPPKGQALARGVQDIDRNGGLCRAGSLSGTAGLKPQTCEHRPLSPFSGSEVWKPGRKLTGSSIWHILERPVTNPVSGVGMAALATRGRLEQRRPPPRARTVHRSTPTSSSASTSAPPMPPAPRKRVRGRSVPRPPPTFSPAIIPPRQLRWRHSLAAAAVSPLSEETMDLRTGVHGLWGSRKPRQSGAFGPACQAGCQC